MNDDIAKDFQLLIEKYVTSSEDATSVLFDLSDSISEYIYKTDLGRTSFLLGNSLINRLNKQLALIEFNEKIKPIIHDIVDNFEDYSMLDYNGYYKLSNIDTKPVNYNSPLGFNVNYVITTFKLETRNQEILIELKSDSISTKYVFGDILYVNTYINSNINTDLNIQFLHDNIGLINDVIRTLFDIYDIKNDIL